MINRTDIEHWARSRLRETVAKNRDGLTAVLGLAAALLLAVTYGLEWELEWRLVLHLVAPGALLLVLYLMLFVNRVPAFYAHLSLFEAVQKVIFSSIPLSTENEDRICIHQVLSSTRYVQLTNYYPSGTGLGRTFSATQGVTGQTLANNMPICWRIPEGADATGEILDRFGMGQSAYLTRSDRRSFYAFPVGSLREEPAHPFFIVYLDSAGVLTFDPEREPDLSQQMREVATPLLTPLVEV